MANRSPNGRRTVYVEKKKDKNSGLDDYKGGYGENYCRRIGTHDLAAAGYTGPKGECATVSLPLIWASANDAVHNTGRAAVSEPVLRRLLSEDSLTRRGRPAPSFKNKKDKDDNNGGGDDPDNGHSGGNNKKESRDRDGDGNKDKDKRSHDDGGGYSKGKNMDFLGEDRFGYGYAYHAGYENGYPVGQLKCAQQVRSSQQSKCAQELLSLLSPPQLKCTQQVSSQQLLSLLSRPQLKCTQQVSAQQLQSLLSRPQLNAPNKLAPNKLAPNNFYHFYHHNHCHAPKNFHHYHNRNAAKTFNHYHN